MANSGFKVSEALKKQGKQTSPKKASCELRKKNHLKACQKKCMKNA